MTTVTTEQTPPEPLAPCPFCGDDAKLYVHELDGVPELEPSYRVECTSCGGSGPGYDDIHKSVMYWNRACTSQQMTVHIVIPEGLVELLDQAQVALDLAHAEIIKLRGAQDDTT